MMMMMMINTETMEGCRVRIGGPKVGDFGPELESFSGIAR